MEKGPLIRRGSIDLSVRVDHIQKRPIVLSFPIFLDLRWKPVFCLGKIGMKFVAKFENTG